MWGKKLRWIRRAELKFEIVVVCQVCFDWWMCLTKKNLNKISIEITKLSKRNSKEPLLISNQSQIHEFALFLKFLFIQFKSCD